MKKRLTGLAVAFCLLAALALPAHAQDYNFTAPSAGDFGTTSGLTPTWTGARTAP